MADEENQEDELLALASIYDERIFVQSSEEKGGQFNVFLDLPKPFKLKVRSRHNSKGSRRHRDRKKEQDSNVAQKDVPDHEDYDLLEVQHLPPIILNFRFPKDYPSKNPPLFTLSCKWLSVFQLSKLCKCLDKMWCEDGGGEVIMFRWLQFLQDETVASLNMKRPFPLRFKKPWQQKNGRRVWDDRAFQDVASYYTLVNSILEYDQEEKRRVFRNSYFTCTVCFCERPGSFCIEFQDCGHVFCVDCMRGYFKVQIEDGAVRALNCPTEKCESQALPFQVKELVSPELFAKYDRFLLQYSLDGMSDIVYCPRPSCQTAVLLESESSMGVCSSCSFAFCAFCKHTYHGVSPCLIKSDDMRKLHDEYTSASEEEKKFMEKRFGKQRLQQMVEEVVSEKWLYSNAKQCPTCKASIQKIDGCNKMTCIKCRAYFCWLCMETLSRSNPYQHFNAPGSQCFNRLFEGIEEDEDIEDDDDDWWNV